MKTNEWNDEDIAIPEGLEAKLEQLIDDLAEQEMLVKRRRLWLGAISAAASILLAIGVFFHTKQPDDSLRITQNIENNQEFAYLETQKALEKISLHFNKGMNQLAFVSEKMNETNQILNKTLKKETK
jgi:hypothetical protein